MTDPTSGGPTLDDALIQLEALTELVALLSERVNLVADGSDTEPSPPPPDGTEEEPPVTSWAQRASDDDWLDLIEWVEWLTTTYELVHFTGKLVPCWPAHGGVVEELAGLRSAWIAAQRIAVDADTDALAAWHDRALHPFINRFSAYQLNLCTQDKHKTQRDPVPTDRDYVIVQTTGEVGPQRCASQDGQP